MAQRGYTLETGPHTGCRGYFAVFRPETAWKECDKCGQNIYPDSWDTAGHGLTLHQAIVMAAKIALGRPVVIPSCEMFR